MKAYITTENGSFFVELDTLGDIMEQLEKAIVENDKRFGRCNRCNTFTMYLTDAHIICANCDPNTWLCDPCHNYHLDEVIPHD